MNNPLLELERTLVPPPKQADTEDDELEIEEELDGMAVAESRSIARALALQRPIRYRVPGSVPLVSQPGSMNCWAAMMTMLLSWRDGQSLGIEEALGRVGSQYEDFFRRNTGLPVSEKAGLLAAAGIAAEPPTRYSAEDLERMLRENGPLWVTYDDASARLFSLNARLVVGLNGTAHGRDVRVEVINPESGRQYSEKLRDFLKGFARVSRTRSYPRLQILHSGQPTPNASNGGGPLAGAPASAQAVPAAVAVAGPAIAGAGFLYGVLKDIANNKGDVSWKLQSLDGAKYPKNDPSFHDKGPWQGPFKFQVKAAVENPFGDEESATFDVEYYRNGVAVGYVDVSVAGTNDAWLGSLDVTQTIRGLPDDTAGGQEIGRLELRFTYVFDQPIFNQHIYRETITLYGDGRATTLKQWPQP